jgi:hypothetical protein
MGYCSSNFRKTVEEIEDKVNMSGNDTNLYR